MVINIEIAYALKKGGMELMNKHTRWKYLLVIFGMMSLLLATPQKVQAASWKDAYKEMLRNWKKVEDYAPKGEFDYLKYYFGSKYGFDKYYVYNLDKKGNPELFLHSDKMDGMTAVMTYQNGRLYYLGYYDIYGINRKKKAIIVQGHWHGAGGSGADEWGIYQKNTVSTISMISYIDKIGGKYCIGKDGKWSSYNSNNKKKYKTIFQKYVKGTKRISKFKKYKLSDLKGLK